MKTRVLWLGLPALCFAGQIEATTSSPPLRITRILDDTRIELVDGKHRQQLRVGERYGAMTLTHVGTSPAAYAVLEDFTRRDGRMLWLGASGVMLDLPKTLEATTADPRQLMLGHTVEEARASPTDLLGDEILARPGDPDYASVAPVFAPIRKVDADTYSFVGTPLSSDKVGFTYGGRSPNFDPVTYQPSIAAVVKAGEVWNGLVGGYLPVLRFVYPEADGTWTELLAFAPLRLVNGNDRIQPVWYRVSRIENGALKWIRYVDTYQPFPPRAVDDSSAAQGFYQDLMQLKPGWDAILGESMKIELPDERVANMARFGLVRAILTRAGDFPKYGAVDKNYAGSEHDGFPDTFTVETAAMLEWGLTSRAGRYIDNYFSQFVRDDGSLLYRGPEIGQFGRMLTVLAQYADRGGDPSLLLKLRPRISAITELLRWRRAEGRKLPADDPAHGLISGWSEADASLELDPPRYMQPYFSNSTEAARGFHDLGAVWRRIGTSRGDEALTTYGARLMADGAELENDVATAFARSILEADGHRVVPAIAGAKQPFHLAVQRDPLDPQYRAYRAYMEMMYSGNLSPEQVGIVIDSRARHHDVLLGVPVAYGYNTGVLAGFLAYGHGYGLIQHDRIREALLLTYSHMAHQYTRGTWMAPETRPPLGEDQAAPYCTPAQLVASLMTRWLLVFEDPRADVLWLGKGIPRAWLEDGKVTWVWAAPTRWGRVSFDITSHARQRRIEARIARPEHFSAETRLRLRAPAGARMKSVTLNGRAWNQFDAAGETIVIPAGTRGAVEIVARY
ncbi:MAG TPA: hypothetical protein VK624_05925 [Steroidobacteraceae bacterium]|nr:hypothetical protein [Steroidobacteraceae bacterium]